MEPATRALKVEGIRTLFVLTLLALALALGVLIVFFVSSHETIIKSFPTEPTATYSAADINKAIGSAADFDGCAISYVAMVESADKGGQCGVSKMDGFWKITISGNHVCRVICFKNEVHK
jgi:hypothetical protein